MMKAYDHVEWGYLYDCLCKLGFSMDWITGVLPMFVMQFVLMGSLLRLWFQIEGLDKGILSVPIYFLLCTHLLFADDTMFFARSDRKSVMTLKGTLSLYYQYDRKSIWRNLHYFSVSIVIIK
jgi:hypothetical protein